MYCVKNNDKGNSWYCLPDDTYLNMYKVDEHMGKQQELIFEKGVEFYRENGATEYFINGKGQYEKK